MAFPNPRRVQQEMEECLSCPTCSLTFNLDERLPKALPCQHTVCLDCAHQLYQRQGTGLLQCPTCQHLVNATENGVAGLPTNSDVENMVRILSREIKEPVCLKHQHAIITNVCMQCEVGICPKCIASREFSVHSHHEVLELDAAFRQLKAKCDALEQRGKRVRQLLGERGSTIDNLIKYLHADCLTKNLRIFQDLDRMSSILSSSEFVDPIQSMKPGQGEGEFTDSKSDARSREHAAACIQAGKSALEKCNKAQAEKTMCTKLSAVAIQTDVLRLQLSCGDVGSLVHAVTNLWRLVEGSLPCCHRLIVLGGVDLLTLCFAHCPVDKRLLKPLLEVLGSLSEHQVFHRHIVTSRVVNELVAVLHKYTMKDDHAPERACRVLAHLLSNAAATWPLECASKEGTSQLVIDTCKEFAPLQTFTKMSFHCELRLLSQQTSQAAKYWAIWWLHQCVLKHPKRYAKILHDQEAPLVLQNQSRSDAYVRDMCNQVLQTINNFGYTKSSICNIM